jgi:hypothetical protein
MRFPRDIRLTPEGDYLVRSRCVPWCNNVFMVRREFFLETIIAESEAAIRGRLVKGFPAIETEINRRFWRKGDFWRGSAVPSSRMIVEKVAATDE